MAYDWHGVDGNRDLAEYDRWLEERLDHVDKVVLPLALQYGLRVVLDLHVPPGGRDAGAESGEGLGQGVSRKGVVLHSAPRFARLDPQTTRGAMAKRKIRELTIGSTKERAVSATKTVRDA